MEDKLTLENILKIGFYWITEGPIIDHVLVGKSSEEVLYRKKMGPRPWPAGYTSKWSYREHGQFCARKLVFEQWKTSKEKQPDLIILYSGKSIEEKTKKLCDIKFNPRPLINITQGFFKELAVYQNIPVIYNTEKYLEFEDGK